MSMNTSQARVVDPILSNVVRGYKNGKFVGNKLFPTVPVGTSGGQIIEFGKEAFQLYNTRRAPGANTKRVDFGYLGKPFSLFQDALEGKVPFELMREASKVPGINLGTRAVNTVMAIMALSLEHAQATMARDANNYDADHKVDLALAKWTDDANDPLGDIDTGKEAVADSIGIEPNILTLSNGAFLAARRNAKVRENFKYTNSKSITAEMLAEYFDVEEVVVGKAISFDAQGVSTPVWGNDAVLAYSAQNPSGQEEPSFGYTYELDGSPYVETAYQDRSAKSWIYPVTTERAPVIAGAVGGYLLQNVK